MKRRIFRVAGAGVVVALLPGVAAAQYGSGPPPPPPVDRPSSSTAAGPSEPTSAAQLLRAIACAVRGDPAAGTALLATVPRSSGERSRAAALLRTAQRCIRSRDQIAASAAHARGAAAEALYEAQFSASPAVRAPAVAAAPLPRPPASEREVAAQLAPMYALVDCATPRAPDLVRALLATEPAAPEEAGALAALNPAFVACVPAGTQLSIDPRFMRSFFAEALYRWSVVQRDGASAHSASPAAQ